MWRILYLNGSGPEAAGWLAEPDPAALAAVLPAAREGAAGAARVARERYLRRFPPDVLTKQLIDIYADLDSQPPLR